MESNRNQLSLFFTLLLTIFPLTSYTFSRHLLHILQRSSVDGSLLRGTE